MFRFLIVGLKVVITVNIVMMSLVGFAISKWSPSAYEMYGLTLVGGVIMPFVWLQYAKRHPPRKEGITGDETSPGDTMV